MSLLFLFHIPATDCEGLWYNLKFRLVKTSRFVYLHGSEIQRRVLVLWSVYSHPFLCVTPHCFGKCVGIFFLVGENVTSVIRLMCIYEVFFSRGSSIRSLVIMCHLFEILIHRVTCKFRNLVTKSWSPLKQWVHL